MVLLGFYGIGRGRQSLLGEFSSDRSGRLLVGPLLVGTLLVGLIFSWAILGQYFDYILF